MEQFKIQFEMLVLFCGSYNTYEAMMYSTRLFRSTIKIFNSKELLNDDDKLKKYISTLFKELYIVTINGTNEFSNFYIESYLDLRIKINRTQPKLSSYIDLPPQLKNKKCIINVKNNDNLCILYAIATHLYLKDYYKNIIKKIKENYEFPIKSQDIFKEIIKPYTKRIKISDDLSFPMEYIEFKEVIKEYIYQEI